MYNITTNETRTLLQSDERKLEAFHMSFQRHTLSSVFARVFLGKGTPQLCYMATLLIFYSYHPICFSSFDLPVLLCIIKYKKRSFIT